MTASGVSCSRLPVVQQAPGRAEALVELAPADDALVGGQLQKVMLPPAGVAAKDVETRYLHRHSPVARYVRNLSKPPSARVTAVSQASVKFLNSLVILFTSTVGDAIFSVRAGRNREVGANGTARLRAHRRGLEQHARGPPHQVELERYGFRRAVFEGL